MSSRVRSAGRAALLLAACLLAYIPAFRAGFVFDDHALIETNRALQGPLWQIWTDRTGPDYWPLTWTAYWIEWRLWGTNPWPYHVVNAALHAAVAALFWRALLRLAMPGAWLAAILFALHPVAVESVAWIAELKNVLSGVFFMAAALAWLRHDETRSRRALLAATFLFLLACLAKVSVLMLPVVLAAVVLLRRGRLARRDVASLAPLLVVSFVAGLVNLWFQHHNALAQGWAPSRGLLERLGGAGWALAFYVRTAFLPVGLGFVHGPWPVAPGSPSFFLPLALVALVAVALVVGRDRWRWAKPVGAALGYQATMLLPVLGFVDMAYFRVGPVSQHLQYLALLGPMALVAALAMALRDHSTLVVPVSAAAVLALGVATFQRAAEFRDDETLWAAAARDAPTNAYAHAQLARLAEHRADAARARDQWARAAEAEVDPARQQVYRAWWLASQGRRGEAAGEALAATSGSMNPEVREDAAEVLVRIGRASDAIPVLAQLSGAAPANSSYAYALAKALWHDGRTEEAVNVLQAFRRDQPRQPEMEKALGIALALSGRTEEAKAVAASAAGVGAGDPRAAETLSRWLGTSPGPSRP